MHAPRTQLASYRSFSLQCLSLELVLQASTNTAVKRPGNEGRKQPWISTMCLGPAAISSHICNRGSKLDYLFSADYMYVDFQILIYNVGACIRTSGAIHPVFLMSDILVRSVYTNQVSTLGTTALYTSLTKGALKNTYTHLLGQTAKPKKNTCYPVGPEPVPWGL